MIIKHRLTMDFNRVDVQGCIDVMQDDKYSRDLVLSLKSNMKAYCPPEGCQVLVRYNKSNGQGGMYDSLPDGTNAWSIEENILTVRLAPQVCTAAGKVMLYITLILEEKELNCFAVCVNVHERPGLKLKSENYHYVKGFIPQPDRATAGEYLKVLSTDADGRITAVGTGVVEELPSRVSQLENDCDYATRSELPKTFYFTSDNGVLDKSLAEIGAAYQAGSVVVGTFFYAGEVFTTFLTYAVFTDEFSAALFNGWSVDSPSLQAVIQVSNDGSGDKVEMVDGVRFVSIQDIPTCLPNPCPLTINGLVYDGATDVNLTIDGGSGAGIPDYVREEAERLAAVVQARQNENTISAILSSDYHLPTSDHGYYPKILEGITHAGQAMEILRRQLSIDFEAKLGDLIWDGGETPAEAFAIFRLVHSLTSGGNVLGRFEANGNHDHLQSNTTPLTDSQVYANIGVFNRGCVKDPANRAGGYCYKDYEEFRLRVILLNTSEADDGSFAISSAQLTWLGEALAVPVDKGWGTLILSHHPLDWGGSSTAVMKKIKAASGVIANVHGHVHTFTQDVITGTEIPRLAIPNVCFYRNNEYGINGAAENSEGIEFGTVDTYTKTVGTANDTSFCVMTIDRENGRLYLDHYGAGLDREAAVPTWAEKGYTNLVPVSEAADSTSVYNGTGYKNGYYLSSNGAGQESADSNCVATGFIPYRWVTDNPIYVKGASVTSDSHVRVYGHTSKDYINNSAMATGENMSSHFTLEELSGGNYYKLTPLRDILEVTYVRLSLIGTGENLIVTANEPIEE